MLKASFVFGCAVFMSVLQAQPSVQINESDLLGNDYLLPTTYYIAQEETTPCHGRYRQRDYSGQERALVLTPSGDVLAEVCERFLAVLKMEGTGVLRDRGQGPLTVNWAGEGRFLPVGKCRFGLGVQGLCLLPYYTIAADLQQYPVGTVLYVPRARGIILPDGSAHEGFFVVRDTGSAFRGIGRHRVDWFIGFEVDGQNAFSRAGFHHRTPEHSFLLTGESEARALEFLKAKFGPLFN